MRKGTRLTMSCALAVMASACTLPADDAGELLDGTATPDDTLPIDEAAELLDGEHLGAETDVYAIGSDETSRDRIDCELKVHRPHHSRHKPENANVVTETKCSAVVSRIMLDITLTRDGLEVGYGHKDKRDRKVLDANAHAPCIAGVYRGHAQAEIHFPAGYEPSPQTIKAKSAEVYIPCTIPAITQTPSGAL